MTANQVTVLRLVPMPLVAWLVYQGHEMWWWALGLATLVACTDWVDGYLARRQGPTVLGGLLDPLADKVFVALTFLPLTDPRFGVFGALPITLLFIREFLVTALRSAYAQRDLEMRTSYLAKIKTWSQMQGIGLVVFVVLLADQRAILLGLVGAAAAIPALIGAGLWIATRRVWRGAFVMAGLVALMFLFCLPEDPRFTVAVTTWLIVAVTWGSGLEYVVVGLPRLKAAGGLRAADLVRVAGAVAFPVLAILVLRDGALHPAPLLAVFALELAAGGIDNLLSVHRAAAGAAPWGARVAAVCALLGAALALPEHATLLTAGALCASAVGLWREVWRVRAYV